MLLIRMEKESIRYFKPGLNAMPVFRSEMSNKELVRAHMFITSRISGDDLADAYGD